MRLEEMDMTSEMKENEPAVTASEVSTGDKAQRRRAFLPIDRIMLELDQKKELRRVAA